MHSAPSSSGTPSAEHVCRANPAVQNRDIQRRSDVLASKRRRSDTLSPQLISQNNSSRLSYNRFRVLFLPSCPSHPLTRQQRVCGCGPARPHVAVRDHVQPVSAAVLLLIANAPLRSCLAFIQRQTVTLCARYDISTSQMLVTAFDFSNADRRSNLQVIGSALLILTPHTAW